jgi:HTH DNA binding domain
MVVHRPSSPARASLRTDPSPRPLVEVRARTPLPEEGLEELLREHGARARLIGCRPTHGGRSRRLLRWLDVEASPAELRALEQAMRQRFGRDSLSASSAGRGRAVFRLSVPLPGLCSAVFLSGGVCLSCPYLEPSDDGTLPSVRVLVPRNGEVARLGRELAHRDLGPATVERMGQYRPLSSLTARQEATLRTALELGYFEYPRRAELADVARRLGIGRSATLELLRRALSAVARRHYTDPARPANRF